METSFDFSIIPKNQFEYDRFKLEYDKLDEISKLTVEILHNPSFNDDIIEIDYTIEKVCILMRLYEIDYPNLPLRYKISPLIINTFVDVLTQIEKDSDYSVDHEEMPDLFFEDKYLPIILIYNKNFIIRLLQIKACNVFYNYKINHPDSFLLNDYDINKNALNFYCFQPNCNQFHILSDINQTFYDELIDYFFEKAPDVIRWIDDLDSDFGINIEITEKHHRICLDSDPSLHMFIYNRYGLPNDYKTLEHILELIEKDIELELIAIPPELQTADIYTIAVRKNGLNIKYVPEEFINKELVQIAVENTPLANLVIPIEYITDDNLDSIFELINLEQFQKLCLYTCLDQRESYFSEEQLLIVNGPCGSTTKVQKISTLVRSNREFLLKYVKYRGIHNFIIQIVTLIVDY